MIYIYDALYSIKKETTKEYIKKLFGISYSKIEMLFKEGKPHNKRWYFIDENTSCRQIRQYHSSYKIKDEAWKDIPGTGGIHKVSNYGRVKTITEKNPEGKFALPYCKNNSRNKSDLNIGKRRFVKLRVDGKVKEFSVSRLVAYSFNEIPKQRGLTFDRCQVSHKNGILHDDYHCNLVIKPVADIARDRFENKEPTLSVVDRNTGRELGPFMSIDKASKALGVSTSTIADALVFKYNRYGQFYEKYSVKKIR